MGHIRVKVGRLADHEKKLLVSKSLITQDDLNDLEIFSNANYFVIKKCYLDEKLCGYAVFFLGYHGLESNDISIERICFSLEDMDAFYYFICIREMIKKDGFFFPIENIYCEDESLSEEMLFILSHEGILFTQRSR